MKTRKIVLACCTIMMVAVAVLGYFVPKQVYITGFIPSSATPTLKWVRQDGKWYRQMTIPVIIKNDYRGNEITAYVDQSELLMGHDSYSMTVFKDSYPLSKGKPVYVAMRQTEAGFVITRADLHEDYFTEKALD